MSTLRSRTTPAEFAKLSDEFLSRIEELKAIKDTVCAFGASQRSDLGRQNDDEDANQQHLRYHHSTRLVDIDESTDQVLRHSYAHLLEYLVPRLADFQITYEDAFGKEEMFSKVMEGFDLCNMVDAAFLKSVEEVMLQVKENKELRFRLFARTSGVQGVELLKANDDWPSPEDFVCRAPLRV